MISPSPEFWDEKHWFALRTRGRHEKAVDRELRNKGFDTFLPLRKVTRRWSDRSKKIEEPIFTGYLFAHFPLRERLKILQTAGAVCLVGFNSFPAPVPERDLDAIRRFVTEEISIDPYPYLKQGDRVYVSSGQFRGVEGFIVRKDQKARLVISLGLLMQSISVEIDSALVEKV